MVRESELIYVDRENEREAPPVQSRNENFEIKREMEREDEIDLDWLTLTRAIEINTFTIFANLGEHIEWYEP